MLAYANGIFEELDSIVKSSCPGNGKEPVWDGSAISKTSLEMLKKMLFIENCHGYWFPTDLGYAVYQTFCSCTPHALSDYGYSQFCKGKESKTGLTISGVKQ